MEYVCLGNSGLKVSRLILGCMSFGKKTEYGNWVIEDENEVMSILKKCYDLGIRTYDTADMYSNGVSEELLGKFLVKYKIPRYSVVILSKCYYTVDAGTPEFVVDGLANKDPNNIKFINSGGLSRKHVLSSVETSTKRLGTHLDILQIHRFDKETPIEETMRALNDAIESGKVTYIGASSMRATQFAQMQFVAEKHGWHKFISMQNFYNLLYREEEREMIPFCQETGVGLIHWSPVARGILARPLEAKLKSERINSDMSMSHVLASSSSADDEIIKRVEQVAEHVNGTMAQVAIAWIISKGGCPILGLTKVERVEEAVGALKVKLTDEQLNYLEEPYLPKAAKTY